MVKHRLCWVLCLGIAGCGGSPAAPSPGGSGLPGQTVPQFSTGRYLLKISAPDSTSTLLLPVCGGSVGGPPAGTSVSVFLTVVKDGDEWVGRTSGAAADIEMRFRDAGELPSGGRALAGTIRGQAPDMGLSALIRPHDLSVTVAGTVAAGALMEAHTVFPYFVNAMIGQAVGDFRFRDSAGNLGRCSTVEVLIGA